MATTFPASGFGGGNPTDGVWQVVEQLRSSFDKRVGSVRGGKGDVRAAVLALLGEKPMHGYQIIREIEERSGGNWKPSAGSVYPTLQLLADEGLISAVDSDGRKTYDLTDAGRELAKSASAAAGAGTTGTAPWDAQALGTAKDYAALPKSGVELAQVMAQVGRTGSPEQVRQAVTVIDEARRRLFAILAQD